MAGSASGGGGLVSRVVAGSPAGRAGITSGERIVAANGRPLTDVIAWWWESDGESVDVTVTSAAADGVPTEPSDSESRDLTLERSTDESWGVQFASPLFDAVRICRNRCSFCFMAQLPRGLRPALYVRDDDYRLSFLAGNFITLTNLTDEDIERITSEHLSPLHVSLHAVSPEVRERLICAREDRALERFDELVEAGIDLHVQIVLVPGVNDGEELEATLTWLAAREGVRSVGVVPLGYTAHQDLFVRSYEDPASAIELLDSIAPWSIAMRERDGVSWVYAADEFYLNAARPVPPAADYDGFPQYENGIGLLRTFIDEFRSATARVKAGSAPPVTIVTGTMFAPVLAELLAAAGIGADARVVAVENRFFGGNVAVTGLLAGSDIAAAVRASGVHGAVLVPDVIFNDDGLTLDDLTAEQLRDSLGAPLQVVPSGATGLLSAIL